MVVDGLGSGNGGGRKVVASRTWVREGGGWAREWGGRAFLQCVAMVQSYGNMNEE